MDHSNRNASPIKASLIYTLFKTSPKLVLHHFVLTNYCVGVIFNHNNE